ncbi:hypothetical protein D8674_022367 [Pyrus ussuriensis x Pyrus communis]|uniref:Uncharacterized protein n=1 Tax=Pyrus ussuriensis x Pyrus communis TaxID=2448454 RepID=A0A5N5GJS9_9ROSA|nr:hypothetical protein D8674_022367 [Pyrus ussuriensis x Pyrus communis]
MWLLVNAPKSILPGNTVHKHKVVPVLPSPSFCYFKSATVYVYQIFVSPFLPRAFSLPFRAQLTTPPNHDPIRADRRRIGALRYLETTSLTLRRYIKSAVLEPAMQGRDLIDCT